TRWSRRNFQRDHLGERRCRRSDRGQGEFEARPGDAICNGAHWIGFRPSKGSRERITKSVPSSHRIRPKQSGACLPVATKLEIGRLENGSASCPRKEVAWPSGCSRRGCRSVEETWLGHSCEDQTVFAGRL